MAPRDRLPVGAGVTAMIGCDGCGAIVQDRGEDEAATWLALTFGPTIGDTGLLPTIDFSTTVIELGDEPQPEPEPIDLKPVEPVRHFCTIACLRTWAERAEAAA